MSSTADSGAGYLNFNKTVEMFWDDLQIEDKHKLYASGQYLCMKDVIFEWFEVKRRRIYNKEIAKKLLNNMSDSNFKKTYDSAYNVVLNKIRA